MPGPMQAARLADALVRAPRGFVFVRLLQALTQMDAGGWRLLERGKWMRGRNEGVMQLLLLPGPLWQQTSIY